MITAKIKEFLKLSTLFSVLRFNNRRNRPETSYNWEGVYLNYHDLPPDIRGFNSKKFVDDTYRMTCQLLDISNHGKSDALEMSDENTFLSMLVAAIAHRKKDIVRILDFGGGMGVSYIKLKNTVPPDISTEYHIIEQQGMCEGGSKLFKDDERIRFHTDFPRPISSVDIVYINSALQYMQNYAGVLRELCTYQPEYFLLVRFSAGNVPTYVSLQKNVIDTDIPYYFFNISEIISIMATNDYSLLWKAKFNKKYSMDNFPQQYRLDHQSHLLFARN